MKRFLRHPALQWALARLLSWYLAFALATTRWRLEGVEFLAPHAKGCPAVVACWHECLTLMPRLWKLSRRLPGAVPGQVYVLASHHYDGRFIGAVLQHFGVGLVLGSSNRGGAAALRLLAQLLRSGSHVCVTPDGPRGPRRVAAPGTALLAALSGAPVLPCAAQTTRRWILHSWDRMVIPLPFGRGVIVCQPPIMVPRVAYQDAVPVISGALTRAADEADRLCAA